MKCWSCRVSTGRWLRRRSMLELDGSVVRRANVVLGHVAPIPWISFPAGSLLVGQPMTPETAARAGRRPSARPRPFRTMQYKVQAGQGGRLPGTAEGD